MASYDTDGREVPDLSGLITAIAGGGSVAPTGVKKKEFAPFKFQMPDWTQFTQQTGFGYNNPMDQLKDAFRLNSQGGGVFMGNKAPRYGTPAPNMTFPTQFQGLLGLLGGQGPQPFQRPGNRGLLGK